MDVKSYALFDFKIKKNQDFFAVVCFKCIQRTEASFTETEQSVCEIHIW